MADNDNNLVFTVSSDMSAAQRGLAKFAVDVGAATDQIARKYQAAGAKIDSSTSALQTRINGMVGLGAKASKEWTGALADQGKELERLRARYSPLFATINQYKTAVADIKQAHALGAISANEMATAISRERQAALASTAAIKGRNAVLTATPSAHGGSFNTSNLAAQGFDIAATAPSMPWQTVALQQGPQVAQVFNDIRASGQKIGPAVAGAFMQLVNPISLVTIGAIGATAAAIGYFSGILSNGDKSAEKLKEQAQLIQDLAARWGDVIPALREYANELARAKDAADLKEGATIINTKTLENVRKEVEDTRISVAAFVADLRLAGEDPEIIKGVETAFKKFADAARDGKLETADVERVQTALAAALKSTGIPAISEFKDIFDKLSASALTAAGSVGKVNDAASRNLPISTWRSFNPQTGKLETNAQPGDENIKNPGFMTPEIGPTPEKRPNIELEGLPGAEKANKSAETAATKAANAYRDLQKAADDRIGQVKQEIDLLGKYGIEVDAARFALDLFQQSEDKGRSLSDAQRAEIQKKVDLYKQYSETLSKAKLQQDLLMDMRFNSLSKQDQQVTTTLRQYGLPEDLNSSEAASIRQSIKAGELRDDLHSFASDFKNALLNNGGDIGKAFADAIQNAALNQISKIADRFIEQIINGIIGGVTGQAGGASSGIGSAISTAITGAVSGKAPVTAVTRSPLAAIPAGSTKTGIDLAQVSTSDGLVASVNKKFAANFQGLIDGLEEVGYKIKSIGGYNYRNIAGTNKLSNHAFGDAIDINPGTNPMGRRLVTDMPSSVSALAAQNGLTWGGDWNSKKDAMHFEVQSSKTAADALNKLAGTTGTATQGLGQFGSGLSQFGTGLGSMAGGGGGGGWGQLAGGFFGGVSPLSPNWAPNTTFSAFLGLADGGHVAGPGGPTSDSIPAMLSNGEFVVNADSARKHRRLLDAINSGSIAKFARGGLVGGSGSRVAGHASAGDRGVVVNITNNANAQVTQKSRQTAGGTQIDVLVDEMVADKVSTPGSRSRGAMQSQFGLRGGLARR
ncbi:M15 family metallopeptidase [Rhizobium leguminosarum]|uniref:Peptidase M15C domain-containing protein n=1 Tax=Rhizobium leguminosarum TaxID=384 RepID=A0A7W9ZXF0_RHILE|nr:M15 family metallopeptidase [Rhizobium leguminosarum]MBB6224570.1 hypothetical protein [Rhizobium leguminosarum]